MSKRDYGLLDAAGISVAEAARLFKRSRQALYTGLSHERPYFSAENARTALEYAMAMGRDAVRIDGLVKFIDENYPPSQDNLTESELMPERVGLERLKRFVDDAEEIVILFNGSLDLLAPTATFAKMLKDLPKDNRPIRFVIPDRWAVDYIEKSLRVEMPLFKINSDFLHFPSFILTRKLSAYGAFLFMRFSVSEMRTNEAMELWVRVVSMFEESAEHKSRASG